MKRLLAISLVMLMTSGCAVGRWSHRHPVIAGALVGVPVGGYLGWRSRNVVCHYDNVNVGIYPAGHCPKDVPSVVIHK